MRIIEINSKRSGLNIEERLNEFERITVRYLCILRIQVNAKRYSVAWLDFISRRGTRFFLVKIDSILASSGEESTV